MPRPNENDQEAMSRDAEHEQKIHEANFNALLHACAENQKEGNPKPLRCGWGWDTESLESRYGK